MKLPPEILNDILSSLDVDESVIIGPKVGEDFAVIKIGEKYLVVHSDPITGASKHIGWYSVIVPANDIATSGAKPKWLLSTILASSEESAKNTLKEIAKYAKKLGISVVGGHTEVTPGLPRTIVSSTAMGIAEKLITTSGAREGDLVYISKGAGIEGTAIIANDFERLCIDRGVPEDILQRAKEFIWEISVLEEAAIAAKYATSMHDATEGGVLGGLLEVSMASRHEIIVEDIPIRYETKIICKALGIDPRMLISSGTLIMTIPENLEEDFLSDVERVKLRVYKIGKVARPGVGVVLRREGRVVREYLGEELDKLY
ncbi:MAG: AIR synthase family protein [Euryarchaeota archaeon]|nr:AIR synthase family protein [Euryarchaeota archaeon]